MALLRSGFKFHPVHLYLQANYGTKLRSILTIVGQIQQQAAFWLVKGSLLTLLPNYIHSSHKKRVTSGRKMKPIFEVIRRKALMFVLQQKASGDGAVINNSEYYYC